jgi:apolipoprotein N-acyltransferase
VVLVSLYLAVFPATAAGLAWRWGRRQPLTLALLFAAAWIVTEWLRATLFTGFAWNPIGVTLIDRSVAPLAALVGTYGLSAMVILFAGLIRIGVLGPNRRPAFLLAVVAVLAQVAAAFALRSPPPGEGLPVRIVQPNIGQEQKWSPEFADRNMMRLGRLSRAGESGPRLLIWPEAAVTEPLQDERQLIAYRHETEYVRQVVQAQTEPGDLLLTGGSASCQATGPRDRRHQQRVRDPADGRIDPRRRISFPMANICRCGPALGDRPVAPRPRRPRFRSGTGAADARHSRRRPGRIPALLRDHLLRRSG